MKKEDLARIRKEIKDYAKLKNLVDRWVALATELSDLKVALKRVAK